MHLRAVSTTPVPVVVVAETPLFYNFKPQWRETRHGREHPKHLIALTYRFAALRRTTAPNKVGGGDPVAPTCAAMDSALRHPIERPKPKN